MVLIAVALLNYSYLLFITLCQNLKLHARYICVLNRSIMPVMVLVILYMGASKT